MRKKSDQAKCCGINIPVRGTSRGKVHEMGKSLALSRNRKGAIFLEQWFQSVDHRTVRVPETPGQEGQNCVHNNAVMLFVCFTVLTFTQWCKNDSG